jgi:hypothetical protein
MGLFSAAAHEVGLFNPAYTMLGQVANLIFPSQLPSAAEIMKAVQSGTLSTSQAGMALRGNGIEFPDGMIARAMSGDVHDTDHLGYGGLWKGVFDSNVAVAAPGELLQMLNQNLITKQQFDYRMKLQGFWWGPYREELVTLSRNRIPSPSELVRFALKDVWNDDIVTRFQYDAEYPKEFEYWMERMGANGNATAGPTNEGDADFVTWGKLFWRSHWANISPGQAFEMFQRLRPDRIQAIGANIPGLRAFTFEDLNTVLRVNDYPVPYRAQLAAIAYRKPRLVDIDRFYADGAIDENETYNLHLDLGYSPADARLRTNWLVKREAKKLTGADPKSYLKTLAELYQLGRLTWREAFTQAIQALTGRDLGPDRPPAEEVQARRDWDRYAPEIMTLLNAKSAAREIKKVKQLTSAYRRQFLRGMLTSEQLRSEMMRAEFRSDFIDEFIGGLLAELASGRLLLSTSQIRKLVIQGILPLATATKYLLNLGWKEPEISYLTAQIQRDLDVERAKLDERAATNEEHRQLALVRQIRLTQRRADEQRRRLNRQSTPSQLKRFFVRAIISEGDYVRELERRGFNDDTVKRFLQDARIERTKYLASRSNRRTQNEQRPLAPVSQPEAAPQMQTEVQPDESIGR